MNRFKKYCNNIVAVYIKVARPTFHVCRNLIALMLMFITVYCCYNIIISLIDKDILHALIYALIASLDINCIRRGTIC